VNRRAQRRAVTDPQGTIPRPPTYGQLAHEAGFGCEAVDLELWLRHSRANVLYSVGLDWRTYPDAWPMPRTRYDHERNRRVIIDADGAVVTSDEWMAHCRKAGR